MATKRRQRAQPRSQITPALGAAWRANDRDEVKRLLHQPPWEPSIFDVVGPEPPAWVRPDDAWAEHWPRLWALREGLDAAAAKLKS